MNSCGCWLLRIRKEEEDGLFSFSTPKNVQRRERAVAGVSGKLIGKELQLHLEWLPKMKVGKRQLDFGLRCRQVLPLPIIHIAFTLISNSTCTPKLR